MEEFTALRKPAHITGEIKSEVNIWCDILKPMTAQVLCTYTDRYFKDRAAITVNSYVKGKVYYIGCDLETTAMKNLIRYISKNAGIKMIEEPHGIEIVQRDNCTVIMNHNNFAVQTSICGKSLISGENFNGRLDAYGVEFIVDSK